MKKRLLPTFRRQNFRTHPVSQEETPNKRLILPEHEILIECDTFALCRVGECEWRRKTQIKTKKVLSFRLPFLVPIGVYIETSAPFSISVPGVHQWTKEKKLNLESICIKLLIRLSARKFARSRNIIEMCLHRDLLSPCSGDGRREAIWQNHSQSIE